MGQTLSQLFRIKSSQGVPSLWERLWFSFERAVGGIVGTLQPLIIPKKQIFDILDEVLPKGHMTQLNAASFLNALALRHKHSHHDPITYLKNHLALYNAPLGSEDCPFEHVANIEKIKRWSVEWDLLQDAYDNPIVKSPDGSSSPEQRLQAVKIRAWALDLEATTGILHQEVEEHLSKYKPPKQLSAEEKKNQPTVALPKEEILKMLRAERAKTWWGKPKLNDTQVGILLCHLLHARETRNNKKAGNNEELSYVTHPMAVAYLCVKHAHKFLPYDFEGSLWVAVCDALNHDGGEKSGVDVNKDLVGLHDKRVINGIQLLHKPDGMAYFEYINRFDEQKGIIEEFVKLCDLDHNSSDAGDNPTAKQAYVYTIAANFLLYRIRNPEEKITVATFVNHLFGDEEIANAFYARIHEIAESVDKKDADGNVIEKALKKRKASDFPDLQDVMDKLFKSGKLIPVSQILETQENNTRHANPRREKEPALQP